MSIQVWTFRGNGFVLPWIISIWFFISKSCNRWNNLQEWKYFISIFISLCLLCCTCPEDTCHRSLAPFYVPKYSPAVSLANTNMGSPEGCRVHSNRVVLSLPHHPAQPHTYMLCILETWTFPLKPLDLQIQTVLLLVCKFDSLYCARKRDAFIVHWAVF